MNCNYTEKYVTEYVYNTYIQIIVPMIMHKHKVLNIYIIVSKKL